MATNRMVFQLKGKLFSLVEQRRELFPRLAAGSAKKRKGLLRCLTGGYEGQDMQMGAHIANSQFLLELHSEPQVYCQKAKKQRYADCNHRFRECRYCIGRQAAGGGPSDRAGIQPVA